MSEDFTISPPDAAQVRKLKRFGIGAAVVALAVVGVGIATRSHADSNLDAQARDLATTTVTVVRPDATAADAPLVLPGAVQAFNSAAIYARTNGYIRRWLADIGDEVKGGQALAILDAPDLDQQLAQAKADYQTTVAQQDLARTTAERWATLLKSDAVSRQESDEKAGDYKARVAVANASLANVKRLQALKGFTQLTAPFAGTVTSRSAQIGALVVAGNAAAQPLFTVSDVHRVRIYVRVPQNYSSQVKVGMHVAMTFPEYPGRTFDAVMTRSAGAVDNASGAVLVELQAPNPAGELKPGAFAQVKFPLNSPQGMMRLPASTLVFTSSGTNVAVVDAQGRVRMKPITIARDLGNQIEVSSGVSANDRIIDTPPDAIQTGDVVKVSAPRAAAAKAGADAKG
ncbi:efflux RND transporter periplasmic adaptor subunit [Sphingomonas naphthae]|uniref:Efflux RND transporter periplasmic adaptor subunit n=1 Tax=Sphingomonas naphthae TaxID=1813468 RepID=A0ABY7TGX5_9SPHN|nr:efflux RND transporter periplasmic adaptor subunit [Sphingomonas naphthae]WCT72394.1 efflux RND transporter periplasmic adaptor subunit [Sphingomonas naphthae]